MPGPGEQPPSGCDNGTPGPQLAWHPNLRDDEVDALEREITDDNLSVPQDLQERARVASASLRLMDLMLLKELTAANFAGPVFDVAVNEWAAYGIAVMMAWMRTGEIARKCGAKGRPLPPGCFSAGKWSRDDRLEMALETTARALDFFVETVLKPGRWDPARGATMKTFFVGACLLQFSNEFNRSAGEQQRWVAANGTEPCLEDLADVAEQDACWSDPTSETAVRHLMTQEILNGIRDPKTRHAARMVMLGRNFADAGRAVGLSAAAVEGRLYRLRRRSQ